MSEGGEDSDWSDGEEEIKERNERAKSKNELEESKKKNETKIDQNINWDVDIEKFDKEEKQKEEEFIKKKKMRNTYKIIDSHVHCGIQNSKISFENVILEMQKNDISGCCVFAPPGDIYDRYCEDEDEEDENMTKAWKECRKNANNYLKEVGEIEEIETEMGLKIYPYFFVWNDFDVDWKKEEFKGIKWHRHKDEPKYKYDDEKCEIFLKKAYKDQIPIVYEDTFENTLKFIRRVNGKTIVIIPHMGFMNGGFYKLKQEGVFDRDWVYCDTSLVAKITIADYCSYYSSHGLLYGSDYPAGIVDWEIKKIKMNAGLTRDEKEDVFYNNIKKLMDNVEANNNIVKECGKKLNSSQKKK